MKSFHHRAMRLALAGMLGAASASAFAGGSAFKSYDSNGDGKLSIEEYQAQGGTPASFGAADANGDKKLSHDEFAKMGAADATDSGYSGTSSSAPPAPESPRSGGGM